METISLHKNISGSISKIYNVCGTQRSNEGQRAKGEEDGEKQNRAENGIIWTREKREDQEEDEGRNYESTKAGSKKLDTRGKSSLGKKRIICR